MRDDYKFLLKSHKTLLMLRRTSFHMTPSLNRSTNLEASKGGKPPAAKPNPLELRHQRTGDVVFDWQDTTNPFKKPAYYTYKLIEILLPKAMNKMPKFDSNGKCSQSVFDESRKIKMVELWSPDPTPRKGWLKVCSLK